MLVIGWESNKILTRQEPISVLAIYQKQAKVMIILLERSKLMK